MNPKIIFSAIKKYAPTILSGMAVVGVGLTGWLSYRAARKFNPEKTVKEQYKNYIPMAVAAVGTIGCIVGANYISISREAIALAAVAFYKAANDDYEEFKDAAYDNFGDAGLVPNVVDRNPTVPTRYESMKIKIWEPYTRQWFEASQEEILWAELTANKMLHGQGYVTLNDVLKLYSDKSIKMKKKGDILGWSWDDEVFTDESCSHYCGGWIGMCPQFEEVNGTRRFVMDYELVPNDISEYL